MPAPRARGEQVVIAPVAAENAAGSSGRRSNAALDETKMSVRPSAGFLAQYVDQHFPWPRAPLRKERQRQRATQAYITADMLPDLLAETLRLRPLDRKL